MVREAGEELGVMETLLKGLEVGTGLVIGEFAGGFVKGLTNTSGLTAEAVEIGTKVVLSVGTMVLLYYFWDQPHAWYIALGVFSSISTNLIDLVSGKVTMTTANWFGATLARKALAGPGMLPQANPAASGRPASVDAGVSLEFVGGH